MDQDKKNALPDFLLEWQRIYKPTAPETDVLFLSLCAAVQLSVLGALLYYLGDERKLKLAMSFCTRFVGIAAVALTYHNRGQCTQKHACKVSGAGWVKLERDPHNTMFAVVGFFVCLLFLGVLRSWIVHSCAKTTALLRMIAQPICDLLGGLAFTDAPIEKMFWGHSPFIGLSAAVCAALTQPQIMCVLECAATYTGFILDLGFFVSVCATYVALIWFCIIVLDHFCRCGIKDCISKELLPQGLFLRDLRANIPTILPPTTTTAIIADKHNIKEVEAIAEKRPGAPKYTKRLHPTSLYNHFAAYCTVGGAALKTPDKEQECVKLVLRDKGFSTDGPTIKLYVMKELIRLELLDEKK
jgi:hypothetical protein